MLGSLIYFLLSLIILGVLIFIHELGHYWMARRVGMRVEAFGIGFGRAVYRWTSNGVEWRFNWLPFGGYVRIAGQDNGDDTEGDWANPAPDTFYGRPPLDRIKVAAAGPIANLLFALVVFTLLWSWGGRDKAFREFTPKIGWVDPQSELFREGIRPGDEITSYGDRAYVSGKDHLYGPMTATNYIQVKGVKVDYSDGERVPYEHTVFVYPHPRVLDRDVRTAGILDSASYLIYQPKDEAELKGLAEGSPLVGSGIQPGDRLIWANGELLFSQQQLMHLMNDQRTLLTIQRGNNVIQRRVPRVLVQELRLDPSVREELADWQFAAGLQQTKLLKLYALPYNMTVDNVIENPLAFIDKEVEEQTFPKYLLSPIDEPLMPGDKILAVDGTSVKKADAVLAQIQTPHLLLMVIREPGAFAQAVSPREANDSFTQDVHWDQLQTIVNSIGTDRQINSDGNLVLLYPIVPKTLLEFAINPADKVKYANDLADKRRIVDALEDPDQRAHAQQILDESEHQLNINPPYFRDRRVTYNPTPLTLFAETGNEIWRTLGALVSGRLGLKWVTGPIGLLQIVQENWSVSIKEGLFWVGAISLNLGFINLLPVPVLDGGTIALSLLEIVTRRRLKPKTMERLVIPFAVALILLFVFLTYNDLMRLLTKFVQ